MSLTDAEVKAEFLECYRYAHDYWAPFVSNAQIYTLAAANWSWNDTERKMLYKEGREPLEMNIMRRPMQFYAGYLRDHLNSVIVSPVEGSKQETADQLTKLMYYVWDKGQGYPMFLDAADEALKAGMSLCGIRMDYSKDFINGDISFFRRTFNSFYLDPTFERIDLKDCSFAIMRDLISRDYIKQLIPFVDPKRIEDIQNAFRDEKFLTYHPNFTTLARNRNLLSYDQYYKRKTRCRKFLVDDKTGFFRDISDMEEEEIRKLNHGAKRLRKMFDDAESIGEEAADSIPRISIQNVDRDYVELNIMLNGQTVYTGEDKSGIVETYPFVPLLCYFEPSIWMPSQRCQGIPATLWSLQRQFNKRHMKIVDMMDSDISTGFKYLIGSVPDPSDMQQSGQNKIIGVDPANAPEGLNSVQQLNGGGANPTIMQYQEILDKLSLTLANINESVIGIDEKGNTQVSGRLAQVRIAQGLRGNRKVFDNIEQSQLILGGIILLAIQKNYPASKVERIIGETPTDEFYDGNFEQYDACIKQGVRSQSQRDEYYSELVNLKREGIVDVPQKEIIRAMQMAGLSDLQKALEAQEQEQAAERAMAQEAQKLEMGVLDATRQEKLGLAEERKSRVVSNLALKDERESEAQQNIAQSALDRARTITEIASMHEDRLLKVIELVRQLEQEEAAGRESQKSQVANQASGVISGVESVNQQSQNTQQSENNQENTSQENTENPT